MFLYTRSEWSLKYIEENLEGLRFMNDTPLGISADDYLAKIDGEDVRSKSEADILKLFSKDKVQEYDDIYQLTIIRKSHPDQLSIISGNKPVSFHNKKGHIQEYS